MRRQKAPVAPRLLLPGPCQRRRRACARGQSGAREEAGTALDSHPKPTLLSRPIRSGPPQRRVALGTPHWAVATSHLTGWTPPQMVASSITHVPREGGASGGSCGPRLMSRDSLTLSLSKSTEDIPRLLLGAAGVSRGLHCFLAQARRQAMAETVQAGRRLWNPGLLPHVCSHAPHICSHTTHVCSHTPHACGHAPLVCSHAPHVYSHTTHVCSHTPYACSHAPTCM